jgi:hypothetical protein
MPPANLPAPRSVGQLAAFNWNPSTTIFPQLFNLQDDENLVFWGTASKPAGAQPGVPQMRQNQVALDIDQLIFQTCLVLRILLRVKAAAVAYYTLFSLTPYASSTSRSVTTPSSL